MFILWERTDILKWGKEEENVQQKYHFNLSCFSLPFQDGLRLCGYHLKTITRNLEKIKFILNVFVLVLADCFYPSACSKVHLYPVKP